MNKNFLLKSEKAKKLYYKIAKDLPIIDYHNHLSVGDINSDKKFSNIYELWIQLDPYKHRLMRIKGIPEKFITGDAKPFEKFYKFCSIFPMLAGTPVYDWCKMELSMVFGIDDKINEENAKIIYDKCNNLLTKDEFSVKNLIKRFNVEYLSPVANILDDLSVFDKKTVCPSLRGDNLLEPTTKLKEELSLKTGVQIKNDTDYIKAVAIMLDEFQKYGCKIADHSLDSGFFNGDSKRVHLLVSLANEYAKRSFTLLIHFGAKRKTSERLLRLAGPAGGYASVGEGFNLSVLCDFLGEVEKGGQLPSTILFPLNMADIYGTAVMQGSFSQDNIPSKVGLGPAWWWCDHRLGIKTTLDSIASFGVLSEFIGMTTDSRSILSLIRHDYFRRIFCSYIAEKNQDEEWGLSDESLSEIVKKVCYQNAKNKIVKGDNYGEI